MFSSHWFRPLVAAAFVTFATTSVATPRKSKSLTDRPTLMTVFFAWYRYVPLPDGSIDPWHSGGFFSFDSAHPTPVNAMTDDFPDTWTDGKSAPEPYRSIVGWDNPHWFTLEFRDMARAGIDIALLDAWTYLPLCAYRDNNTTFFSWNSITNAAAALHAMQAAGEPAPRLAMFWESYAMAGYDLTTGFDESSYVEQCGSPSPSNTPNAWAAWLQVREFFRAMGKDNAARSQIWGTIDGRPVIQVYCPAAAKWTQTFWNWLSDQFLAEFGVRPYIILDSAWLTGTDGKPVRGDAPTIWEACFNGPTDLTSRFGGDSIPSVGAGSDSSLLMARWADPTRLREDGFRGPKNPTGNFYDWSWQRALAMNPKAVLIETWNERHEGTGIARSSLWGDAYIQQTAKYATALHNHVAIPLTTQLNYPDVVRKRLKEGEDLAGRTILRYTAANDSNNKGVYPYCGQASTVTDKDGGLYIERAPNQGLVSYSYPYLLSEYGSPWSFLHVRVADGWGFDLPDNLMAKIRMTFIDDRSILPTDPPGTMGDIYLAYDSWDSTPNSGGSGGGDLGGNTGRMVEPGQYYDLTKIYDASGNTVFASVWGDVPLQGTPDAPQVRTIEWPVRRPRFGNRQNTGADFKIAIRIPDRTRYSPLRIISVELEVPNATDFGHYHMGDVVRAARIVAGIIPASKADQVRYDVVDRPGSTNIVTVQDVVALAREVAGVDPNPVFP